MKDIYYVVHIKISECCSKKNIHCFLKKVFLHYVSNIKNVDVRNYYRKSATKVVVVTSLEFDIDEYVL